MCGFSTRMWKAGLKGFMIPSRFVLMGQFPLTANGKVDRRRLQAPGLSELGTGSEYIALRNGVEKKLVLILFKKCIRSLKIRKSKISISDLYGKLQKLEVKVELVNGNLDI